MTASGHELPAPPAGEVFDLGYRSYDGEREGRWHTRRAIWRDGVRAALGFGRPTSQKIVPFGLIGLALVPVLILIVLSSFASSVGGDADEIEIPSFAEYYSFAIIPIMLFAAIVSPQLLCPDRREGVITLYFVRPITPADYIFSRWFAFLTVTVIAVWFPEALLFVWEALQASSTGEWLGDNWDILPRFLAAGAVIAVFFTTLAMFLASFTTRRAYAAVLTLAVIFIGAAINGIAEDSLSGTLAEVLSLAGFQSVESTVNWIFGEPIEQPLAGYVYALWLAGVTVVTGGGLLWRYRRLHP